MFEKQPLSLPKIGIISAGVTMLVVIIAVIMSIIQSQSWQKSHVTISGAPESMPKDQVEGLGLQLKNLLVLKAGAKDGDKISATIRTDSYSENTEQDITTANFLIDVDDYKQTYKVVMDWSKKVEVSDGIIIRCPTTKESKYPESHCVSMYDNTEMANTFDAVDGLKDFPIIIDSFDFSARRAIHFEIRGAVLEDGSLAFTIVDYTGGLKETAMDVLQQMGYEFDGNATVNYYDMTDQYNDFPEQE